MAGIATADDELELAFALQRNPGAYALLVGAGVSLSAGMPSASEVQTGLLRELSAPDAPADPLAWWRERTGDEARYDQLLARLGRTPLERQSILRRFFEPDADERARGAKVPSAAHRAIARLVVSGCIRIVVTLNFDALIETALLEAGVSPVVVSSPADFAALPPLHAQRALVVHLHGDYLDAASMLNTPEELGDYAPAATALMGRIADEYGLIAVGWSATWDPALRALLSRPSAYYSTWWIEPVALSVEAERLLAIRLGTRIEDTADRALGRIADAVDAMRATAPRHPRTASVAVASAKRALQGETRAIGLHDELKAEFSRLAEHPALSPAPFSGHASGVRAEVERRLVAQTAANDVLGPLVAATAYWGDSDSDRWWLGELERLARAGSEAFPALVALQNQPASLLLHVAGAAAVAAERFELVHRLLVDLVVRDPAQGHLTAAEGLAPDRVLLVPGAAERVARSVIPTISDHLVLGRRASDEAWELFHYLQLLERAFARIDDAVLADLEPMVTRAWSAIPWGPASLDAGRQREQRDLDEALDARPLVSLPTPYLRGGGHGSSRAPGISAPLRRELANREETHPLVVAGFADGDLATLRTMISVVDHAVARSVPDMCGGRPDDDSGRAAQPLIAPEETPAT